MWLMDVLYCVSMSYNQRIKTMFGFDKSTETKSAAMKENLLDGDALKGSMDVELDHEAASVSRCAFFVWWCFISTFVLSTQ